MTEIVGWTRLEAVVLFSLLAIYVIGSIAFAIFESENMAQCNKLGGMYIDRQCIVANVIPLDKN